MQELVAHFHGTRYSGLVSKGVEVFVRKEQWGAGHLSPRPIPFPNDPPQKGVSPSQFVAVVPIISRKLICTVQNSSAWAEYIQLIYKTQTAYPNCVGIYPVKFEEVTDCCSKLTKLLNKFYAISVPSGSSESKGTNELICRALAQGIFQMLAEAEKKLQIFISHTLHTRGNRKNDDLPSLTELVREIISKARLQYFFDENDLQLGQNWEEEISSQAERSAMLALRSDLYASRSWCQKEILIAKRAGMPIVILDSLVQGEDRGSFLMDNLPRIRVNMTAGRWNKADIRRGLNLLVDECLKRKIWQLQKYFAENRKDFGISWWAPHAPEPVTMTHWLRDRTVSEQMGNDYGDIRILHPDPPLGFTELCALKEMFGLMGYSRKIDILTPSTLSVRGA